MTLWCKSKAGCKQDESEINYLILLFKFEIWNFVLHKNCESSLLDYIIYGYYKHGTSMRTSEVHMMRFSSRTRIANHLCWIITSMVMRKYQFWCMKLKVKPLNYWCGLYTTYCATSSNVGMHMQRLFDVKVRHGADMIYVRCDLYLGVNLLFTVVSSRILLHSLLFNWSILSVCHDFITITLLLDLDKT